MAQTKLYKILKRLVDVRPDEASGAGLLFLYFFLITSTAYVIKTVKISLFLVRQNPSKLPFAYLMTAVSIGFAVYFNAKLLDRLNRQRYISLCLIFFISNIIVFWILFSRNWIPAPFIFWFWADIFMATSVTQFWILVNDFFTPRQAKRMIGFLISGGLLGGVFGSLSSMVLVKAVDTVNLLLLCPLFLGICLILTNTLRFFPGYSDKSESTSSVSRDVSYKSSFLEFRKSRHLLFLAGIMTSAIIVTTLIDFQFNSLVEQHFARFDDAQNRMTAFLGAFFTGLLIFSYFLHIVMTNRILRKLKARVSLMITPLVLLTASAAVFVIPGSFLFYWAVAVKGLDKGLAHSLSQSLRELLYIPVPKEIKYRAKVFIDMFINKLAKGFGALLLIVTVSLLKLPIRYISILVALVIIGWILLNYKIAREYVTTVKEHIKIKWRLDPDRLVSDRVDLDLAKHIFDMIQDRERSSVLYTMNLFDLAQKGKLTPELKKAISFKSDDISPSGMDSLFDIDGESLLPQMDDYLEDREMGKQIQEIISLPVYQDIMNQNLEKVVLNKRGSDDEVVRMEAAKVIGMMHPSSHTVDHLKEFLRDESVDVLKYAIESAAKVKERELAPYIIAHLRNPALQRTASEALARFGVGITGMLNDYLADSEEDPEIRRTIPDILAHIGEQKSADVLTHELANEEHDSRSEIVRALYKIRLRDSSIYFPSTVIHREISNQIKKCCLLIIELSDVMADQKKAPLVTDVNKALARSLRQIFELLSLIYVPSDVMNAYQNICEGTKKNIDYSIELLDNMVKKDLMELLIPLIDDIPFEMKLKKCKKGLKALEKLKDS